MLSRESKRWQRSNSNLGNEVMAEEILYKMVNNVKSEMTPEEVAELQANRAAIEADQWMHDRMNAYGTMGEQLDLLWHDIDNLRAGKLGEWYKKIKKAKSDHPKPA